MRFQALLPERVPFDTDRLTLARLSVVYTGKTELTQQQQEEYLAWARKRVQNLLDKVHRMNIAARMDQLRQAHKRKGRAEAMVDALSKELQPLGEKGPASASFTAGLDQQLTELKGNQLTLRVELAGLRARHESILKHIGDRKEKMQEAEKQQEEVLSELVKTVETREQQVAMFVTHHKRGTVSTMDMMEAQVQLSTARADLAERRQLIAQQAGAGLLEQLDEQLADVQIEMSAVEAQFIAVDRAVKELVSPAARKLAIDYDRTSRRLDNALAEEAAAAAEMAELRRAVEAIPEPRVVVISPDASGK